MPVKLTRITSLDTHPTLNHLSVYTLEGMDDIKLVSMKVEDEHRYQLGAYVLHIPPETIWPEWLLKRMDFWNEAKGKGTLGGSKGNRLKARTFDKGGDNEVVSFGMLFPVVLKDGNFFVETHTGEHRLDHIKDENDFSLVDTDFSSVLDIGV